MKNWAMLVAAAALSGVSFSSRNTQEPTATVFTGIVIVYVFILRFYVRAMLCFNNLNRWNVLQSDCVRYKLIDDRDRSKQELHMKLQGDIKDYYLGWFAVVDRKTQLLSNLKLGFYLLFGLAFYFLIWAFIPLWQNQFVRGLALFAILNTALEAFDFATSKYFDNPARWAQRKSKRDRNENFPHPKSHGGFMLLWLSNVLISLTVAFWPAIKTVLCRILTA
jgi:hypothetical protein